MTDSLPLQLCPCSLIYKKKDDEGGKRNGSASGRGGGGGGGGGSGGGSGNGDQDGKENCVRVTECMTQTARPGHGLGHRKKRFRYRTNLYTFSNFNQRCSLKMTAQWRPTKRSGNAFAAPFELYDATRFARCIFSVSSRMKFTCVLSNTACETPPGGVICVYFDLWFNFKPSVFILFSFRIKQDLGFLFVWCCKGLVKAQYDKKKFCAVFTIIKQTSKASAFPVQKYSDKHATFFFLKEKPAEWKLSVALHKTYIQIFLPLSHLHKRSRDWKYDVILFRYPPIVLDRKILLWADFSAFARKKRIGRFSKKAWKFSVLWGLWSSLAT